MSLQDQKDFNRGFTTDDHIFFDNEGSKNSMNPFLAGGPSNEITTINTIQNQINSSPPRGQYNPKARILSPDAITFNSNNTTLMQQKYKTPHSAEINNALLK